MDRAEVVEAVEAVVGTERFAAEVESWVGKREVVGDLECSRWVEEVDQFASQEWAASW